MASTLSAHPSPSAPIRRGTWLIPIAGIVPGIIWTIWMGSPDADLDARAFAARRGLMRVRVLLLIAAAFVALLGSVRLTLPAGATEQCEGSETLVGKAQFVGSDVTYSSNPDGSGTITATAPRAVLYMCSFNLAPGNTLNVVFSDATHTLLIKVPGSATIGGELRAQVGRVSGTQGGNVWFAAPSGVLFDTHSITTVGGLLATTADISDRNFLEGYFTFYASDSAAHSSYQAVSLASGARISGFGGLLAFVAPTVWQGPGAVVDGSRTSDVVYGAGGDYHLSITRQFDADHVAIRMMAGADSIDLYGATTGGNILVAQGAAAGTAGVFIGGQLSADGARASGDGRVVVTTAGGVIVGPGGRVSGSTVALSTGATFLNYAGPSAIVAVNQWAIYAPNPDGHTYGGLDSGTTALWGADIGSPPPGTLNTNRYVFSSSPTLTFTSLDATKREGEEAPGALGGYAVAGFHPGVHGAFAGDTGATSFTGAPALSSAGAPACAPAVGSPYPIDIAQGTLAATSGYSFRFAGTGGLTVRSPRASTTTVAVANATYDGQPHGGTATVTGACGLNESPIITYSGRNGTNYPATTTPPVNAGDYTASAAFPGNAAYSASEDSKDFTIAQATPVVTWADPVAIVYGTALGGGQLNAAASVPGNFAYAQAAGTVPGAGDGQALRVTFTPSDAANYTTATAGTTIDVAKARLTVTADDKTKVEGQDNPPLTATITGFVNGETPATSGVTGNPSLTIAATSGPGAYPIAAAQGTLAATNYRFTFADGTLTVLPANRPPTADAGGPYTVAEGGAVALSGAGADPDAGDTLTYAWDLDENGSFETAGQAPTFSAATLDGPADKLVVLQVCDNRGDCGTSLATVTVTNVAPTVGAIGAPLEPRAVNTVVGASASFTDPGTRDTHTATWDWGDGNTSSGAISAGAVSGSHTYTATGVYTVKLTVTDGGGADTEQFQYVVVYDPSAGFVTGGGWINSPAGAYAADPSMTGKATFGFVSKYQKGATVPTGQTQFQFHAGDLNFHSTAYQWLVISGAKAQYKGAGTINGGGDYGFILTATDGQASGGGGVDQFRIRIWDKATGTVVYDNQRGDADDAAASDAIEGGSIVIHRK